MKHALFFIGTLCISVVNRVSPRRFSWIIVVGYSGDLTQSCIKDGFIDQSKTGEIIWQKKRREERKRAWFWLICRDVQPRARYARTCDAIYLNPEINPETKFHWRYYRRWDLKGALHISRFLLSNEIYSTKCREFPLSRGDDVARGLTKFHGVARF